MPAHHQTHRSRAEHAAVSSRPRACRKARLVLHPAITSLSSPDHEEAAVSALADLLAAYVEASEPETVDRPPVRRSPRPPIVPHARRRPTVRVASYTRISTDEDHQPYSLEAQAERLAAYVKSQEDWELFRRVQALLPERARYSKRASATSPFLLAGLVVCNRCGKHFVGTSAVGNRYRYYTCFSRQRYGTKYCDAERLPAEELDAAVLDALLHTYERTDLFEKAVSAARRRARSQRANHNRELAVVDAGITKAEDAVERYLSAFEAGTLTESQCGKRLEGLAAKVRDLRQRREELLAAMEHTKATAPDADEIAAMRHHIEKALTDGSVPARKALLQALVHEIRVEGRDRVVP